MHAAPVPAQHPQSRTARRRDSERLLAACASRHTRSRQSSAEGALAARKVLESCLQVGGAEIGPKHVGHVELRVGRLEEQKVGEPLLPPGSHQQIRIRGGGAGRAAERIRKRRLVDVGREELTRSHPLCQAARNASNLVPPAVAQSDAEQQALFTLRRPTLSCEMQRAP